VRLELSLKWVKLHVQTVQEGPSSPRLVLSVVSSVNLVITVSLPLTVRSATSDISLYMDRLIATHVTLEPTSTTRGLPPVKTVLLVPTDRSQVMMRA